VRGHVPGQQAGGLALVEVIGPQERDALQRARQLGLSEGLARLVELPAALENAFGLGEAAQVLGVFQGLRLALRKRKPWEASFTAGRTISAQDFLPYLRRA